MTYLLQAGAAGGGNAWTQYGMMIAIIVVFYFFMIRPQMKRQKELKTFRESLAKGDKVVTTGGIYGTVSGIKENIIMLNIGGDIVIKVDKAAVVKDMTDVPQK
ncbi:MAG: preprotein translocase subunit YajC [Draconibacterium sp.]